MKLEHARWYYKSVPIFIVYATPAQLHIHYFSHFGALPVSNLTVYYNQMKNDRAVDFPALISS